MNVINFPVFFSPIYRIALIPSSIIHIRIFHAKKCQWHTGTSSMNNGDNLLGNLFIHSYF